MVPCLMESVLYLCPEALNGKISEVDCLEVFLNNNIHKRGCILTVRRSLHQNQNSTLVVLTCCWKSVMTSWKTRLFSLSQIMLIKHG